MTLDTMNNDMEGPFEREDVHSQSFDWAADSGAAMAVIETVAAVTGQNPMEMAPLNDVISTDALNDLFVSSNEQTRSDEYVQFDYEQCQVRVHADGTVKVVLGDT